MEDKIRGSKTGGHSDLCRYIDFGGTEGWPANFHDSMSLNTSFNILQHPVFPWLFFIYFRPQVACFFHGHGYPNAYAPPHEQLNVPPLLAQTGSSTGRVRVWKDFWPRQRFWILDLWLAIRICIRGKSTDLKNHLPSTMKMEKRVQASSKK